MTLHRRFPNGLSQIRYSAGYTDSTDWNVGAKIVCRHANHYVCVSVYVLVTIDYTGLKFIFRLFSIFEEQNVFYVAVDGTDTGTLRKRGRKSIILEFKFRA